MRLEDRVRQAAARAPSAIAVRAAGRDVRYDEVDDWADSVAQALRSAGIGSGDRVALWLPKGAEAVAAMQGVLRIGAAYVPVDPLSPATRAHAIMLDCAVKAVLTPRDSAQALAAAVGASRVSIVELDAARSRALALVERADPLEKSPGDLAYILCTSGSTGRPKGVCISHANALAFVDWAVEAFGAHEADRFASHAPFHFDLSVLDLYAAFSVGATVCLVPEGAAYAAEQLARFLREERISVWYSVPSAIVLMMHHGALLSAPPDSLRALLFAGETFPITHLRRLREAWPHVQMWNLYGPTETNVCTAHRVERIDPGQTCIPIGRAVCGDRLWVRTADGAEAKSGEEGELVVQGPTVFGGYWGHPLRNAEPYATGDWVRVGRDGELYFLGRRDGMVKIRGHRVELGEIESTLLAHAAVREVVAMVIGEGLSARLLVFLATDRDRTPTLLEVKRFCAERLPRYMIPDDVVTMSELPRNGNGKIDRTALAGAIDSTRKSS